MFAYMGDYSVCLSVSVPLYWLWGKGWVGFNGFPIVHAYLRMRCKRGKPNESRMACHSEVHGSHLGHSLHVSVLP